MPVIVRQQGDARVTVCYPQFQLGYAQHAPQLASASVGLLGR